jgi:hypothetical protein
MALKTKLTNALVKHTSWDYTDYDNDQIKCACGWRSQGFLPRTREQAEKVFAAHLADEVIKVVDIQEVATA